MPRAMAVYPSYAATCAQCYHEVYRPGPPGANEVVCPHCHNTGTLRYNEQRNRQEVLWNLAKEAE
jgi:hypothetical protein